MEKTTSYTNDDLETIINGPINLTILANALADSLDSQYYIYDTAPVLETSRRNDDEIEISIELDDTTLAPLAANIGRAILHHLKVVAV